MFLAFDANMIQVCQLNLENWEMVGNQWGIIMVIFAICCKCDSQIYTIQPGVSH